MNKLLKLPDLLTTLRPQGVRTRLSPSLRPPLAPHQSEFLLVTQIRGSVLTFSVIESTLPLPWG